MKIGFFGDLHLGAGRDLGISEYGDGSRFLDQERVLDTIGDTFIGEECGAVCFLGDAFHHALAKPWEILAFQFFIRRLTEAKIRVVIILGNHDVKGAALPTALDLFKRDDLVTLASSPRLVPVDPFVFACLPWTPMSVLVAAEGRTASLRDTAIDLLVRSMQQLRLAADSQHPELLPVLLAHWSVSGSSLPNGLPVDQLGEPVIPWIDIDTLGWKLAVLGHIHNAQIIAADMAETPIIYTGSAAVCNLGELGQKHGVWIYDGEIDELRFVAVEDRRFIDHDVEFGPECPGDGGSLPLPPLVDGAVVRVRYRANGVRVDEAEIRRVLLVAGAHKVFVKEVDRPVVSRARIEAPAGDVSAADALGLYVEASGLVASRNGDAERFIGSLRERHLHYVERLGA